MATSDCIVLHRLANVHEQYSCVIMTLRVTTPMHTYSRYRYSPSNPRCPDHMYGCMHMCRRCTRHACISPTGPPPHRQPANTASGACGRHGQQLHSSWCKPWGVWQPCCFTALQGNPSPTPNRPVALLHWVLKPCPSMYRRRPAAPPLHHSPSISMLGEVPGGAQEVRGGWGESTFSTS